MRGKAYVPNVVYTCGALAHGGRLVLPYAMSDTVATIVTLDIDCFWTHSGHSGLLLQLIQGFDGVNAMSATRRTVALVHDELIRRIHLEFNIHRKRRATLVERLEVTLNETHRVRAVARHRARQMVCPEGTRLEKERTESRNASRR
jgi:hypothetical protein